jgi:hypothetical protein
MTSIECLAGNNLSFIDKMNEYKNEFDRCRGLHNHNEHHLPFQIGDVVKELFIFVIKKIKPKM